MGYKTSYNQGCCPLPLLYPSTGDSQFRYASVSVGAGRAAVFLYQHS